MTVEREPPQCLAREERGGGRARGGGGGGRGSKRRRRRRRRPHRRRPRRASVPALGVEPLGGVVLEVLVPGATPSLTRRRQTRADRRGRAAAPLPAPRPRPDQEQPNTSRPQPAAEGSGAGARPASPAALRPARRQWGASTAAPLALYGRKSRGSAPAPDHSRSSPTPRLRPRRPVPAGLLAPTTAGPGGWRVGSPAGDERGRWPRWKAGHVGGDAEGAPSVPRSRDGQARGWKTLGPGPPATAGRLPPPLVGPLTEQTPTSYPLPSYAVLVKEYKVTSRNLISTARQRRV